MWNDPYVCVANFKLLYSGNVEWDRDTNLKN